MIVAAKLGSGCVCGVDKDSIAIDVAASNLQLNGLDYENYNLLTGNLLTGITGTYDFIAANIFTHVILELLDEMPRALNKDGIFVCSGMYEENKKLVVARLKNMGFEILTIRKEQEWAAIAAQYNF
jgi:ribosomal protein L11 methyltransferase